MKLERGFNTVLSACAGDVRHLLALITKVNAYIVYFFFISSDLFKDLFISNRTSIRRYGEIEVVDPCIYSRRSQNWLDICGQL